MALFVQSAEAALSADSSASTSFADLLSVTLTTGANVLIAKSTFSGTAGVASGTVRILLDGLVVRGSTVTTGARASAMQHRATVTAGSHTVKIQWRAGTLGSFTCNPASAPDADHASLVAEEYTA